MRKIVSIIVCCLLWGNVWAQVAMLTVTPAEYQTLSVSPDSILQEKWLQKITHTFASVAEGREYLYGDSCEPGNYVMVSLDKEFLRLECIHRPSYQAFLSYKDQQAYLIFYDENGDFVSGIKPRTSWWYRFSYNDHVKGYRIPFSLKDRTITLKDDDIGHGWRLQYNPSSQYSGYGGSSSKSQKGYIITSQPIYRSGDTLRVKAYLFDEEDQPKNKKVIFTLRKNFGDHNTRNVVATELSPVRPGLFIHELVLGDSLTIDQEYRIGFKEDKFQNDWSVPKNWSVNFRIEDYQLKENKLQVLEYDKNIYPGENFTATLKATDGIGKGVPNATVKVYALFANISQIEKGINFAIPDTLYSATIETDYDGFAHINIPEDSMAFPGNVKIMTFVEVIFPDGEIKTSTLAFSRDITSNPLKIEFKDGLLHARSETDTPQRAQLTTWYFNHKRIDSIDLPHQWKPDPTVRTYTLQYGSLVRTFNNRSLSNTITATANETGIKRKILISNPVHIPVHVDVFDKSGNQFTSFVTTSDTVYDINLKTANAYHVELRYVLGNEIFTKTSTFQVFTKKLYIEDNFPEKTNPGKEHDAEISIVDFEQNPVPKTDVSVVSFASHFSSRNIPTLDYYGRIYPSPSDPTYYKLAAIDKSHSRKVKVNARWVKYLNKGGSWYYQMLLNPNDSITRFVKMEDTTTMQIAVYPIRKGIYEKPIYVEVNYQIAYYHDAEQTYSFKTRTRKNTVSIRLYDCILTLNNIPAIPGYKTVLSVDVDKHKIKFTADSTQFTSREIQVIKSNYFVFNQPDLYIESPGLKHITTKKYGYTVIGPSNVHLTPNVYNRSREVLTFPIEKGYGHKLNYEYRTIILDPHPHLSKFNTDGSFHFSLEDNCCELPDTSAFFYHPLKKMLETSTIYHPRYAYLIPSGNSNVKFHGDLQNYVSITHVLMIAEYDTTSLFKIYNRLNAYYYQQIKPGKYTLLAFNLEDYPTETFKGSAVVVPGKITYLNFERIDEKSTAHGFQDTIEMENQQMQISLNGNGIHLLHTDHIDDTLLTYTGLLKERFTMDPISEALISVYNRNGNLTAATISDKVGAFSIRAPKGVYTIKIHHQMYKQIIKHLEIKKNSSRSDTIILELADTNMTSVDIIVYEEVLIHTGAKTVTTAKEIESMAVRDITSIAAQSAGVYAPSYGQAPSIRGAQSSGTISFIDGVKVRGSLQQEEVYMGGLPAQYGDQSSSSNKNDDIPSFTENTETFDLDASGLRSNFSDAAIWEVDLLTDKEGKVRFTHRWPDDITTWETHILAMNPNLQTGQKHTFTKAYKPLQARLFTPRFSVIGDSIRLNGQIQNFTGERYQADVKWKLASNDSIIETHPVQRYRDFQQSVQAESKSDSLDVFFGLQLQNGYMDGEQRYIPLYPKGAIKHDGMGFIAWQDTTFTLGGDDDHSPKTLQINQGVEQILLDELYYLRGYVHGCNEQMASRLLAQVLNYDILKSKGLSTRKTERDIKRILRNLEKNQNSEGGWSWWGHNRTNPRMSLIIAERLIKAKEKGFDTEKMLAPMRVNFNQYMNLCGNRTDSLEIALLGAKLQSDYFFPPLLEITEDSVVYHKLLRTHIALLTGLDTAIENPLSYAKESVYGNYYWEEEKPFKTHYISSEKMNLHAYEVLNAMNAGRDTLLKSLGYLLEIRRGKYFYNTMTSSHFAWVLHDQLPKRGAGQATVEITRNNGDPQTHQLPYGIKTTDEVRIKLTPGKSPSFINWYSERRLEHPAKENAGKYFAVTSHFKKKGDTVDTLQRDDQVVLTLEIQVLQSGNYLMLEAPIPASCSYGDKQRSHSETHREHFRDRCVVYFENLPVGTYTVNIPLQVRFAGKYTINPPRMGSMYFKHVETFGEQREIVVRE